VPVVGETMTYDIGLIGSKRSNADRSNKGPPPSSGAEKMSRMLVTKKNSLHLLL
jgi:hypothetical protein